VDLFIIRDFTGGTGGGQASHIHKNQSWLFSNSFLQTLFAVFCR
jgi:hypothetical protein